MDILAKEIASVVRQGFSSVVVVFYVGVLCLNNLPLGQILSFCETQQWLCGLESVTTASAVVSSRWMKFQFSGNCSFKLTKRLEHGGPLLTW